MMTPSIRTVLTRSTFLTGGVAAALLLAACGDAETTGSGSDGGEGGI